jgi:hypothetical protein
MKLVKTSQRLKPRLSLVLLDWSVRESFHLLDYLRRQTASRDDFEVIIIEYYDRVSEALKPFEDQVDLWALLEMPKDCYYHKHMMYNVGIALAKGDIIMIGDSDAMVRETFVQTIIDRFDADPKMAYHMDQFRNVRRDFYPFNYPSFEDVLGEGCINNVGGKTTGVLEEEDPLHVRNFGACMCAKRDDLIAIGGADEDLTYLGHVCGPYDLSFRLMHYSRRLVWETEEYMYHTWHPGSDGVDNYSGPHDGRNVSTTALRALTLGRVKPLVENPAVRRLREGGAIDPARTEDVDLLIDPSYVEAFSRKRLGGAAANETVTETRRRPIYAHYKGYDVYEVDGTFHAVPPSLIPGFDIDDPQQRSQRLVLRGDAFSSVKEILDDTEQRLLDSIGSNNLVQVGKRIVVLPQHLGAVHFYDPEESGHPEIIWCDDLTEARNVALRLKAGRTARPEPGAPAEPPPPVVYEPALPPPASFLKNLPRRALRKAYRILTGA